VVNTFHATGDGWQARTARALREVVAKQRPAVPEAVDDTYRSLIIRP